MTPTQLKAVNTMAAVIFGLAGTACFGLAAYLAMTPAPPKAAQYVKRTPDVANCMQALRDLGMSVEKTGPNIVQARVGRSDVDDNPKQVLDLASIGISTCKLPLKAFCMGSACINPGKPDPKLGLVGMTLTLDTADPYEGPDK